MRMDDRPPVGRRAFLGFVGVGLSSLVWGGAAMDLLAQSTRLVPESMRSVLPFGKGWRIYAVSPPHPRFDPDTWRLRIEGLVERPQTFTYAQLQALPQARQTSDFVCVTGWSVDDVRWAGVRFDDLLAAARPLPRATALKFISAEEPYEDSLTLEQLREPDAMLALRMDGVAPGAQARRARARGHAEDVRLQGRQVGLADRRHRPRRGWLLAAARL